MNKELKFYTRPFTWDGEHKQVYDAKRNYVFDFEKNVTNQERQIIIFRLNSIDRRNEKRIKNLKLTYDSGKTQIFDCGQPYIDIRGWGNLNGIGGHNLGAEKSSAIQNDFAEWLIEAIML